MAHTGIALRIVYFVIFAVGLGYGKTIFKKNPRGVTPVIIVPGHGGNQMMMNIDRKDPILPGCATTTNGWTLGWLNIWDFLPNKIDCWLEHNKLVYNNKTGEYHDQDGVSHEVPHWGEVDGVEYLDPSFSAFVLGNVGSYFAPLIQFLTEWGYERGKSLRAAPYDFRFSPATMPHFYDPLKELIEQTYEENGNARVALLAHSMGGLLSHYMLQRQSQEWKNKYVHSMTTMNTPWKGVVDMVEAMVSGYTWGRDLQRNKIRRMQRSCESGVFLLPSLSEWGKNETVVVTHKRNYTISQYEDLFDDIGYPEGKQMWHQIKHELHHLDNPGVDTWCFYGMGVKTPKTLVYEEGKFPDGPPQKIYGDGDGTSNLRSAGSCRNWKDTDDAVVVATELPGMTHVGILSSKVMFTALEDILM